MIKEKFVMGLIKAGVGAVGGVLADQWKEFFYCDSMNMETLMVKGEKRISGRSANTKGSDNLSSNGSGIAARLLKSVPSPVNIPTIHLPSRLFLQALSVKVLKRHSRQSVSVLHTVATQVKIREFTISIPKRLWATNSVHPAPLSLK